MCQKAVINRRGPFWNHLLRRFLKNIYLNICSFSSVVLIELSYRRNSWWRSWQNAAVGLELWLMFKKKRRKKTSRETTRLWKLDCFPDARNRPRGISAEKIGLSVLPPFIEPAWLAGAWSSKGAANDRINAFEMFPLGHPSGGDCFETWMKIKHKVTNGSSDSVMNEARAKEHSRGCVLPGWPALFLLCYFCFRELINQLGLWYHQGKSLVGRLRPRVLVLLGLFAFKWWLNTQKTQHLTRF